jgi:hypothetical protein
VVTPSCGEEHSSITLTIQELENVVPFSGWVNISKKG